MRSRVAIIRTADAVAVAAKCTARHALAAPRHDAACYKPAAVAAVRGYFA